LLALSTALLSAQPSPTIRVPVRLVAAPTTVTTPKGGFINDLQLIDFTLYDNGAPQSLRQEFENQPISLVVAVQANSQISAVQPQVAQIGPILETLIMGQGGEAAVVSFEQRVQTLQPFTNDGEKIRRALQNIEFNFTKSRLVDAVLHSIELLKTCPEARRRVLLLISEKRDQGSESKLRDVVAQAEQNNVIVYSLDISRAHAWRQATNTTWGARPHNGVSGAEHANDPPNMFSLDLLAIIKELYSSAKTAVVSNPLEVLTNYTGGRQYSFYKQNALEDALSRMGEELHGQYLLSFTPNDTAGGYHQIRVAVNRTGAIVRSRPGYWRTSD
jgi:VWFA-related protein